MCWPISPAASICVLIDAPCTGTGTWRRNPGRQMARAARARSPSAMKQQAMLLDRAVGLVKPGGRIAYVTCSVLAEENGDQVRAFAGATWRFFRGKARATSWRRAGRAAPIFSRRAALMSDEGLLMTPRRTDTDGFFVAVLRHSA